MKDEILKTFYTNPKVNFNEKLKAMDRFGFPFKKYKNFKFDMTPEEQEKFITEFGNFYVKYIKNPSPNILKRVEG